MDPENEKESRAVLGGSNVSRRSFLAHLGIAGVAAATGTAPVKAEDAAVPPIAGPEAVEPIAGAIPVSLSINDKSYNIKVDPRTTLLDCLRENLSLTGTKKGCDHGQCGACTVHVDGQRVNSCLTLAVMCQGSKITTIEGLGSPDKMHPMQQAFVDCDAYQCGYCTSGQIMSATALMKEGCSKDKHAIKEAMSGNICRCGAYKNILSAIQQVEQA